MASARFPAGDASIDEGLEWRSESPALERILNADYGLEWRPVDPLAYVPDEVTGRVEAAVEDLDGEILELDPIDSGPAGRVY